MAKLLPYYPLHWTNVAYHCPGYHGAITMGRELIEGTYVRWPLGQLCLQLLGGRVWEDVNFRVGSGHHGSYRRKPPQAQPLRKLK